MIEVYVDGACRPNPGKGSVAAIFSGDKLNYSVGKKIPGNKVSNNQAEYLAFCLALSELLNYGFNKENIIVYSDSELLVLQLTNQKSIDKGGAYVLACLEAKKLLAKFPNLVIKHIPREENSEANLLASEGVRSHGF